MLPEQPAPRGHTSLLIALTLVAIVAAVLVWNSHRMMPTRALYVVPPALALLVGLGLAAWLGHIRRRWLAGLLALLLGLPAGFVAGYIAYEIVGWALGSAAQQGDPTFGSNEAALALVVAPLECAIVSLVGAVRTRRVRSAERTPPARVSGPGHPLAADPVAPLMPHAAAHRHRYYRGVFIGGLAVFAALTAATAQTGNVVALIAVLVVGSFFVPIVYVEYLDEVDAFGGVPRGLLLRIGLLTALFGIPSAGFLEAVEHAGADALIPAVLTGLTEEGVKILLVVLLLRRTRFRFELDGVIVGAAAGMGFAAFEDAGYALTSLAQGGIPDFLGTLWLRQVLGPFGHGTWTAAIAAVIWRERYAGTGRLDARVWIAYITSSLLHAAWDWDPLPGIGSFVWLLAVGGVSIVILRLRVREAIAQEQQYLASAST